MYDHAKLHWPAMGAPNAGQEAGIDGTNIS
jgi:hypothetical protein